MVSLAYQGYLKVCMNIIVVIMHVLFSVVSAGETTGDTAGASVVARYTFG